MRACLIALVLGISLSAPARAQSGVDVSPAIPIHADVPTILRLPDEIERVWFIDDGMLMVQGVNDRLYVRPRPDTPAGLEAYIEVETRTLHRVFLVRVVEHAEDATQDVVVPPMTAARCEEEEGRNATSAVPMPAQPPADAPDPAPGPAEPAAAGPEQEPPASAPSPASAPEPGASAAERDVATDTEHDMSPDTRRHIAATSSPRFDFAVHVVMGLGFTGLQNINYQPALARQSCYVFGLRLTGAPRDALWSLEANVGGEWPGGPVAFEQSREDRLQVTGARLRVEAGVRIGRGMQWVPSAYMGGGIQAHLRQTSLNGGLESSETVERGAVLAFGIGLQYRARAASMGLDFQVRQGWPEDYFSMVALLTIGHILDQEE